MLWANWCELECLAEEGKVKRRAPREAPFSCLDPVGSGSVSQEQGLVPQSHNSSPHLQLKLHWDPPVEETGGVWCFCLPVINLLPGSTERTHCPCCCCVSCSSALQRHSELPSLHIMVSSPFTGSPL
ncbi:unnamed protein product [Pleuronectes platessa]|uniref:Uncharacterized protein n=1 Tax=Pleuronectes platessa TaxID=8262 RepID=A0A9N7YUV9_PLEPL|nr:unnamed protein product [Pleuronectes platessa]